MSARSITGGFEFDPHWEPTFETLAFTVEALFAHPDPDDQELGQLARRASSVLGDWEEIDAAGRALRRAAIFAAAKVRAADAAIDSTLTPFAAALVAHVGGDRGHALYRRFFPDPHEDLIELGLDASLPATMVIRFTLDQDTELPAELREHSAPLLTAIQLGHTSLAERAETLAELGRHQARVLSWHETARATLVNLERSIGRVAEERRLPVRWVRSFFA